MIARPLDTHGHTVDDFTGRARATNPAGQWDRGALYRSASVVPSLPPLWPLIDYSTSPPTYVYFNGGRIVATQPGTPLNPAGT